MVVTRRVAEDKWAHLHNYEGVEELSWEPVVRKRGAEAQVLVLVRIC